MTRSQTSRQIDMQPGSTMRFTSQGAQRLSLANSSGGFVWVTRDGDIRDYWLSPGDAMRLCAGDHVWLTLERSSKPALLTLESLPASRAPKPLWQRLEALLPFTTSHPCMASVQPRK